MLAFMVSAMLFVIYMMVQVLLDGLSGESIKHNLLFFECHARIVYAEADLSSMFRFVFSGSLTIRRCVCGNVWFRCGMGSSGIALANR